MSEDTKTAPIRGVEYDERWPDTAAGWRKRIKAAGFDPDEKLDTRGVADELTRLRRPNGPPYGTDTVRLYLSTGSLPVPAVQEGGREATSSDRIRFGGRVPAKYRAPRPGERIRPRYRAWTRLQIWRWEASRPGPGWWDSTVRTLPDNE